MSLPYPESSTQIADNVYQLSLNSHTLPPFTHTNTYLVIDAGVAVIIDPGFYHPESLQLLTRTLHTTNVKLIKAVLLTHSHNDHHEGLTLLTQQFKDVVTYVHPAELARFEKGTSVQAINAGRRFMVGSRVLSTVFTPGHSPGHLSYYLEDAQLAFAGDMIAGHGSTWIGVPEGNMNDYLASIDRLRALNLTQLAPGHGDVITEPYNHLNQARQHRLDRLEQIIAALTEQQHTLESLRDVVYPGVHAQLIPYAERSLLALLEKLMHDMRVLHLGSDTQGPYALRR